MGDVADYLRMWSQDINQIGFSYVFDAIDFGLIDQLEVLAGANDPLAKALVGKITDASNRIKHEFDYTNLMAVYDAYVEAKVGKRLLDCGLQPVRLPELATPTPDYQITFQGSDFFVEVKGLHGRRGGPNYDAMMEAGFKSLADLFHQRDRGAAYAIAEMTIQPHLPHGAAYDPSSAKYLIEDLLSRVDARLGVAQFGHGLTFGAIDLTLLPLLGTFAESTWRTHPEPQTRAALSGILWHLAFGQEASDLFRPIEFDGQSNLDGQLEAVGLLNVRPFIQGLIFFDRHDAVFLVRKHDEAGYLPLLTRISDTWNNELNEALCRVNDAEALADLHQMVQIKAYELWKKRDEPLWKEVTDWISAKSALGIPACASV